MYDDKTKVEDMEDEFELELEDDNENDEVNLDVEEQEDEEEGWSPKKKKSRAEKRIQRLVADRNALAEDLSKSSKELEELRTKLKEAEDFATNTRSESYKQTEARIDAEESALLDAQSEHLESGDYKAAKEIQKKLNRLASDRAKLEVMQDAPSRSEKKVEAEKDKKPAEQRVPTHVSDWQRRNSWFEIELVGDRIISKNEMSTVALDIHEDLLEEGYRAEDPAYIEELDKRLRKEKPDFFKKREPKSSVAGGGTSSSGTAKRKVRLTKEQLQIAKALEIDPKDYAKQLLKKQTSEV